MKLNPEFVIQEMGENSILVPIGDAAAKFHGVMQLNGTAAFIVNCLQKGNNEEEIKAALADEYEGTEEEFTESIQYMLEQLRDCGALIE